MEPSPAEMYVADILDLAILDSGSNASAIVLGRNGANTAIGHIPINSAFQQLANFRHRIEQTVRGYETSPLTEKELENFGHQLFALAFRDELKTLYDHLPDGHIRIHIISNQSELRSLPWEYIQEPKKAPGPQKERSVVRIVPTVTKSVPPPISFNEMIKVLFISAAPTDQEPVEFEAVRDAIKRTFETAIPDHFKIEPVESATRDEFMRKVTDSNCTILHFSGHGEIARNGQGRLVLVNRRTKKSDYIDATELALLLDGRGIRLVILSACNTSAGNFNDNFAVIAEALIHAGIPAVVANQLPVSNKSIQPFVSALYRELFRSGDIDKAVGEGRLALLMSLRQHSRAAVEWGIPTLYRHYSAKHLYQSGS